MKKGFIFLAMTLYLLPYAVIGSATDGTIDSTQHFAWSKNFGWLNFAADQGGIHVTDAGLTGYIWSKNSGWINLAPTNSGQRVVNNGEGTLSGSAWGEATGWFAFSGVTIDAGGLFHGTVVGSSGDIITFDCTECGVKTDWRPVGARTIAPPPLNGGGSSGGGGGGGGGGASIATTQPPVSITTSTTTTETSTLPAPGDTIAILLSRLSALRATLQFLEGQRGSSLPSLPNTGSFFGEGVRNIFVDLAYGSTGSAVRTLQQFLIEQDIGPAAQALKAHGTTSNFDYLTIVALAEWQKLRGIFPSSGYFGPITRAYLRTNFTAFNPMLPDTGASAAQMRLIVTDLSVGATGVDVTTLQQFLIAAHKGPAAEALGKHGATLNFASLTRAALSEFQENVGITPPLGYFGPITRAYLQTNY